ncbi:MAG: hypothetical protein KF898_00575 [Parachlamydiales bacterium]|nr:hypothetical protein [Candidatus Acheromyda pituitae]
MKTRFTQITCTALSIALLSGCASYNAAPLNNLSSDVMHSSYEAKNSDVVVTAKAYDKLDCKRYLDRDVIAKGYQPIQLYIQNNSDRSYSFSLNRIDLPYARQEEVAGKVHTSTVGRILGYGVPGVIILWPLIIPAVVDGIKSADANEALDNDFSSKIARDQTINPHSYFNKIIFVPVSDFQQSFNVTLIDQESNKPKTFNVMAS